MILLHYFFFIDWTTIGQMSSETEPEPTVRDSDAMDSVENPESRTVESTSSLVGADDRTNGIRKSLLRDEMLINAQKFASQVP